MLTLYCVYFHIMDKPPKGDLVLLMRRRTSGSMHLVLLEFIISATSLQFQSYLGKVHDSARGEADIITAVEVILNLFTCFMQDRIESVNNNKKSSVGEKMQPLQFKVFPDAF